MEVALCPHHVHGGALFFEHRRDVQERVGVKPAEFGLVGLKQKERGGRNSFEGTGYPCAGGELARLFGRKVSHAVVGVEGVFFGMGEDDSRRKLTDGRIEVGPQRNRKPR